MAHLRYCAGMKKYIHSDLKSKHYIEWIRDDPQGIC